MWRNRILVCLICGAILGVVCIVGAALRFDGQKDFIYLFSLWYNRVLMGLVIGVCPAMKKLPYALLRGVVLGISVSFAFFATTGFVDVISFIAGAVYGLIIGAIAFRFEISRTKATA